MSQPCCKAEAGPPGVPPSSIYSDGRLINVMGVLERLRRLLSRGPCGRPGRNVDVHIGQGRPVRDYHRKVRMTIRLDAHTRDGARAYALERGTTVSELCEVFLSGLMWGRQAKKLRRLLEGPGRVLPRT